jgi:hypothetical protein
MGHAHAGSCNDAVGLPEQVMHAVDSRRCKHCVTELGMQELVGVHVTEQNVHPTSSTTLYAHMWCDLHVGHARAGWNSLSHCHALQWVTVAHVYSVRPPAHNPEQLTHCRSITVQPPAPMLGPHFRLWDLTNN